MAGGQGPLLHRWHRILGQKAVVKHAAFAKKKKKLTIDFVITFIISEGYNLF